MNRLLLSLCFLSAMVIAGKQFAMSDADRAIYAEMLEDNPADIFVEEGSEFFDQEVGGEKALAKFLKVKVAKLPKYIAGFPRYIKKLKNVVALDQVLQAMQVERKRKRFKLKSPEMFSMLAYAKSLANDEQFNINIKADRHIKASYKLGKKTYETARGGRGLSCMSCHSPDIVGQVLRTQPLPDLGKVGSGATWPAYRMTKSSLRTLQRRFQGCMKNARLKVIPLGSKEMVGLEVYISTLSQKEKQAIQIPGLKR